MLAVTDSISYCVPYDKFAYATEYACILPVALIAHSMTMLDVQRPNCRSYVVVGSSSCIFECTLHATATKPSRPDWAQVYLPEACGKAKQCAQ